jgi:hypothetical protein
VDDLLCENNIRGNASIGNKIRLSLANIIGEMGLNSISQGFSYDFIDDIAEINTYIILSDSRIILFGHKR